MLFLPAKVVEGLLVIGCSSLYSHIFVEGAVSAFNLTNTTIQLLYLILAGWMANSATRYVGEEYRADEGRGLFSTVSTIYVGLCVLVAIGCCITAAVTQSPVYLGGALMFCTYTAFQVLNAALIQLGRVKASILWSLTSAVLKLAVAFALVGGKSNYPSPFPAIFANTIADGVATIGAVFALSLPVVVRLKYFSKPLLNRFLKYGVPLMGVSISVALLNQIDKYLVVGFYGNILYAYYSNNNSIASGLFTMISVGIMRGVYPAVLRGWREGGKAAAKPLLDQGVQRVFLSLGGDGVFAAQQGETHLEPICKAEMRNATGAGDSFMAGLLYSTAQRYWLGDTMDFAMGAALAALQARTTINPAISPELIWQLVREQKRPRTPVIPTGLTGK